MTCRGLEGSQGLETTFKTCKRLAVKSGLRSGDEPLLFSPLPLPLHVPVPAQILFLILILFKWLLDSTNKHHLTLWPRAAASAEGGRVQLQSELAVPNFTIGGADPVRRGGRAETSRAPPWRPAAGPGVSPWDL